MEAKLTLPLDKASGCIAQAHIFHYPCPAPPVSASESSIVPNQAHFLLGSPYKLQKGKQVKQRYPLHINQMFPLTYTHTNIGPLINFSNNNKIYNTQTRNIALIGALTNNLSSQTILTNTDGIHKPSKQYNP